MSEFMTLDDILNIKRPLTEDEYRRAVWFAIYSEYTAQNLYSLIAQFGPDETSKKVAAFVFGDEKSHEYIWRQEEERMATEADKLNSKQGTEQYKKIIAATFENAAKGILNAPPDDDEDDE